MLLNPALSIRLERMVYTKGKTHPLKSAEIKKVIDAIELRTPIDLRDRVIIGFLAYTACRIAAISKMNYEDLHEVEGNLIISLKEKNGKVNEIPIRSELKGWLKAYIDYVNISSGPIIRGFVGKDFIMRETTISLSSLQKIVKSRLSNVGLVNHSAHSFRAGAATTLLDQGVPQEDVQNLLGHSDPRTTQLYDHSKKVIPQNLVERL